MEHTSISLSSAQKIITISQGYNVSCLPRPVSHSNNYFKPILDSGSDGLIVQMVNNYAQTEKISNLIKYPPLGERTYGVNRAHSYGLDFDGYIKSWNEESILIIQIESQEGVDNIEEITSHPSVDGVMIGPYDLSGSYGIPGDINNEIIEKLTDIGLEVENFERVSSDLDNFKVAKIINTEKHPNADKLKICDVDIGEQYTLKVVCGAPNALSLIHI